jgi:signal peptidase I
MKKLFAVIVAVVLVIVVLVALSIATFIPVLSPALRSVTSDEKTLIFASESMEPTITKGATIYYRPYSYDQIRSGDIIVFKNPEETQIVVARVFNIGENGSTVKGDANLGIYPWIVTETNLIGKVTEIHNP